MNLHYGDARNKNNSSGQNKLNKFTSNTYASSSINSPSSFPTLTSSLNSNTSTTVVVENLTDGESRVAQSKQIDQTDQNVPSLRSVHRNGACCITSTDIWLNVILLHPFKQVQ